jgi:hypothetical protein
MMSKIFFLNGIMSKKGKTNLENPLAHYFQSLSKQLKYVLFREMFVRTTFCEHPSADLI